MRRKSERTVKSSPIKKTEPAGRRSTRRGRKSPEKSPINEEESDNSSEQASSSENEPDEVVAPKRTRRTSRTIEKSSSAEDVKATPTTTRTRRRGAAKKDADIPEEENAEPDQTDAANTDTTTSTTTTTAALDEAKESEVIEAAVENPEPVSVDSSTEPVADPPQVENSSNNAEDEKPATSNQAENEKESEEKTETVQPVEVKPTSSEVVEPSKSRRRTLKRIERQISNEESKAKAKATTEATDATTSEQVESEVDGHGKTPKKSANDEVKNVDEVVSETPKTPETPIKSPELQNGNTLNSDAADTTAKDTTASETDSATKLNKKKPIIRKRKWLTNKTAAPKVQEIAISTDSLKGLISDVKPVPLSDIKLDSSPEADHESDDVKVVSSTSIDYNRRSEEHLVESTEDAAVNISTSRKISIVDSEGEQPLSPAKHNPCSILYITNLVRPFTVLQLKSLLQRTGKIAEDGFWIDKIKSKCFVKYETEDEAIETRHALHGIRWPTSNPKCLNVDFGTESLMEKAIASTADEIKPNIHSRDDRIASSNDLNDSNREKVTAADRPVREWDLGKRDSHRPREVERAERDKEREQKPSREVGERDRERDRDRDRVERGDRVDRGDRSDRGDRRRRSTSVSPGRKYVKKDNEPPLRLLDDLFRKTKTTPCIYWLPLTPEQIAVRVEERKKAIERREALRKEREREEAEERERRREREKRREESRERNRKRRDESAEKDKRRDDSHDRRPNRDRDRSNRDDKRRRY